MFSAGTSGEYIAKTAKNSGCFHIQQDNLQFIWFKRIKQFSNSSAHIPSHASGKPHQHVSLRPAQSSMNLVYECDAL